MPASVPQATLARQLARADRATAALLVVAAVAGFGWRLIQYWGYTVDDAYITARYAQHVAAGHGPVYNQASCRWRVRPTSST